MKKLLALFMLMIFTISISTSIRAATPDLEKSSKTEFVKIAKSEKVADVNFIVNALSLRIKEPSPVIRINNTYKFKTTITVNDLPEKHNYRKSFYQKE